MHTCWSALRETVHIFSVAWFRDRLLFFLCNFVLFTVNQNDINSNILLSAIFSVILPLLSELRLKNRRCNIYTRARFNARSTISIWEDIKKCAHRSVSTLQTIFFLKPLCVATFFFKRWMNRSAFTITSGQCCPGQRSQSHLDMCTVSVSDQSTTCIRWVFTTKARHVYGGYSQKSWTCLPAVFTIKAGHVCCPDQCSRSKLDMSAVSVHDQTHVCCPGQCSRSKLGMSAVSVHDQSWACLPWVFTIKAGHVYRQCSRSKLDMSTVSVHDQTHVCCPGQCSRSKLDMSTVSVHDQTHVCCPDQCSRSKLGMSAVLVSVHDQSWACLPSVFTIKAGHVCRQCPRSKLDMSTVSVHDQSTCVRWVFTIKARHVYGGCSRSKHDMCEVGVHDQSTCVPSVFTVKAGYGSCPCPRGEVHTDFIIFRIKR